MINVNETTWAFIGLFVVAAVILIILARKERKIYNLTKENDDLQKGLKSAIKYITTANAMGIPPDEVPENFDDD